MYLMAQKSVEEALGAGDELAFLVVGGLAIAIGVGIYFLVKGGGRRK